MITLKAISILVSSIAVFSWWVNENDRPKIYFFFEDREDALAREQDPVMLFILRTSVLSIAFLWGCCMTYIGIKYFMLRARYSYPVDF